MRVYVKSTNFENHERLQNFAARPQQLWRPSLKWPQERDESIQHGLNNRWVKFVKKSAATWRTITDLVRAITSAMKKWNDWRRQVLMLENKWNTHAIRRHPWRIHVSDVRRMIQQVYHERKECSDEIYIEWCPDTWKRMLFTRDVAMDHTNDANDLYIVYRGDEKENNAMITTKTSNP